MRGGGGEGGGGGGGVKIFKQKSVNSKHFSFFSFFSTKKNHCGHYVCLPSTKIVFTMFACHLHNSSGMCLHLTRTNMSKWSTFAAQVETLC